MKDIGFKLFSRVVCVDLPNYTWIIT